VPINDKSRAEIIYIENNEKNTSMDIMRKRNNLKLLFFFMCLVLKFYSYKSENITVAANEKGHK
jgi:hypothetical protein